MQVRTGKFYAESQQLRTSWTRLRPGNCGDGGERGEQERGDGQDAMQDRDHRCELPATADGRLRCRPGEHPFHQIVDELAGKYVIRQDLIKHFVGYQDGRGVPAPAIKPGWRW